jgi:probable rRNA maturation factor
MTASRSSEKLLKRLKAPAADNHFRVTALTKDRIPTLPFLAMKAHVLGESYDLSLVIVGDKRSQTLNRTYRNKTYTPNVLSFPLDHTQGEIFLNLKQAKREHAKRGESFEYFVALLFIHSMLHLIGKQHGSTMEGIEHDVLHTFDIRNKSAQKG